MRLLIRRNKINIEIFQIIIWIILIIYIVFALFPILWTLSTSFKPRIETQQMPPTWVPHDFTLENYSQVIQKTPILLSLRNSVILTFSTILLCLVLGLPAAYAFSKFKFKGKNILLYLVLITRAIAPPALVTPFMILGNKLNILDTFFILIIVDTYMWLPFMIWLIKNSFDAIPQEIIDAANIDGCSNFGILSRLILPISITGLISVIILIFIDTWNELLFALAFTQSSTVKPITTTIMYFYTDVYTIYGWMTSAGMLGIVPAIIFVILFQKYIVKGIVSGAVKG